MVALYADQMPERFAAARAAAERGDAEALARAAHAMKSSSAQLGAKRLAALLQQAEEEAERGDAGAAASRLGTIEREYRAFRERLAVATAPASGRDESRGGERNG